MIVFGVNSESSSLAIHARTVQPALQDAMHEGVEWCKGDNGPEAVDVWVALWWKTFRFAPVSAVRILAIFDMESWRTGKDFAYYLRSADALVVGSLAVLNAIRCDVTVKIPPAFVVPPGSDMWQAATSTSTPIFCAMWAGNSMAVKDDGKGLAIATEACELANVEFKAADIMGKVGTKLRHGEMPGYYENGSVLLIPSECEVGPRSAIESMGMGRPVIGTRTGIIPELVAHGVTGCIVKRSPQAFADAIVYMKRLLESKSITIATLCRDSAKRFSVERCVAAWKLAIEGARLYRG